MPYIAAIDSATNGTISCPSYSPSYSPPVKNIKEIEQQEIDESTGETVTITTRI